MPGKCQETSKVVRVNPQTLDSYAGRYQASPDTIVTVRREGDHLTLAVGLGDTMEFFPESEDRFFHKASPTKISFLKDQQGRITDLVLHRGSEHRAQRISDAPLSDGIQSVTVGGTNYRVLMSGNGRATVVLVNGLAAWAKVRIGIEPVARVICYEAVERSSGVQKPITRTAPEQARELHALLESIHAAPPYILVGQSFRGALVRIYADMFPEGVAGLVLVDPFHEAFFEDWLQANQPENYQLFKQECTEKYVSDWDGLIGTLRKAQPPARMSVILLTAGQRRIRKNDTLEQKIRPEDFAQASRAIMDAHQKWISTVAKGKHTIVPDTGHEIHIEQPAFVVEAIKQTLNQVKESGQ